MTTYNTGIVSSRTIFSRDAGRAQSIVTVSSVPQLHYNRGKITSTAGSTLVEAAITPLVRCYTASASTSDGSLLPPKTYCPTSDEITYVGTGAAAGSFRLDQPSRSLPAQNTPAGVTLATADSSNPLVNIGPIVNGQFGYTGAGTGMTVAVQLLYPKTTQSVDEPIFVATIVTPGTGYLPGETFTVTGAQCEQTALNIFDNYSGGVTSPTWAASVVFTITEANFYSGGGGIDRLTPALSEFDVGREIVSSGSGQGAVLTYVNGNDLTFDYNGESGTGLQHGTFLTLSSRNEGLPSNTLTAEVPETPGARASGATFEIISAPPNPPRCRVLSPGTGYRVGRSILFAQSDLIAAGFQFNGAGGVLGSMFFVIEPGDLQLDFQNLQSFVLSPPRGGTVFVANTQTSPPFGGDFPSSLVGETIEAAGQKRQIVRVTGYTKLLIDRPFDPPLVGPTRYSIAWVPPTPSLPSGLIGGTIESNGQTKTIERSWESQENTASLDTWKRLPPNRHVIVTSTPFVPPLDESSYTIRSA